MPSRNSSDNPSITDAGPNGAGPDRADSEDLDGTEGGYPRKRRRTRRRLLRAGIALLAEHGTSGISAGAIATSAGVATGTFYNHFPTVDDFLDAIAAQVGTGIEIGQATLEEIDNDPAVRLAIGVLQLLQIATDDPAAGMTFVRLAADRPEFRSRIRSIAAETIAAGVESGRFTVRVGSGATNAVLGATLQSMRSIMLGETDPADAPELAHLLLHLLGVAPDEIDDVLEAARRAATLLASDLQRT